MPRNFRKRGRKAKKSADKDEWKPSNDQRHHDDEQEEPQRPSWIISSEKINLEATFGYLDADVKTYFRTVDVQIRNWQENEADIAEGNKDIDPNEGT